MSESIKRIVLLSASPKVDQEWAVSNLLAKRGEALLKSEQSGVTIIPVRHALLHHETASAFNSLQEADAIVMIFPLYFFCLPAMLTRFLQDFAEQMPKAANACAVYAIVNCGFPDPEINAEAMRVVEMFARHSFSPSRRDSLRVDTRVPITFARFMSSPVVGPERYFLGFSVCWPRGITRSTLACGRAMMCEATSSPTRAAAVWPASQAAFTAATSPRITAVV